MVGVNSSIFHMLMDLVLMDTRMDILMTMKVVILMQQHHAPAAPMW